LFVVLDDDQLAIAHQARARIDHDAVGGRVHRLAGGAADVDTLAGGVAFDIGGDHRPCAGHCQRMPLDTGAAPGRGAAAPVEAVVAGVVDAVVDRVPVRLAEDAVLVPDAAVLPPETWPRARRWPG